MFEFHFSSVAVRGFIATLCLSFIAGCSPTNSSDETPPTTASALATSSSSSSQTSSSQSSVSQSSASSSSSSSSVVQSSVSSSSSSQSSVSQSSSSSSSSSSSQAALPPVPAGLTATPGNAKVTLTWAASTGATSYGIKRATSSSGTFTQIATATSTTYTDTSVTNGTAYFYVVTAINAQGISSANSAQASATPVASIAVPLLPTLVVAVSINGQVNLTWVASLGATGYKVKRSTTSNGTYTQIATPTSISYTDASVTTGQTYYYVVTATNSAGESANSIQVSVLVTLPILAPTTFGTWINVTPSNVNLTDSLSCANYGTSSVQVDPAHPSNMYTQFNCQGIWKSTDYGATWTGPINTGTNGTTVADCAGGITIAPTSTASVPTIYEACIRGAGTGFWKSVDGGVNWTRYTVAPSGSGRQDYYPPVVDPYDVNHLLMTGHEMNYLVESIDGGQTWTNVSINNGMTQNGGTGFVFFINTGTASSTRGTWLWMAQQAGGGIGTWRTANNGTSWTQVDRNEHPHGSAQIYQPNNNGVVYMAGAYSDLGWGVLRSADYGQTWVHVGPNSNLGVVLGTSKNVYSMFGYPVGIGGTVSASLQIASQPGTGSWTTPNTPAGISQGAAQLSLLNNGSNNIVVGAMWNGGLWRYIEP